MKRAAMLASLLLLVSGCGDGDARNPPASEGLTAEVSRALASLDEDQRRQFLETWEQQRAALESTAAIVAEPEGRSVEEIEQALSTLNMALLRGRQLGSVLRAADSDGREVLLGEIRKTNTDIRETFVQLQRLHPDPSPDFLKEDLESQP